MTSEEYEFLKKDGDFSQEAIRKARFQLRLAKMKNRDAKPGFISFDLRLNRPEVRGVPCERCENLTENIKCVYGDYWLCPACIKAHQIAAIRARNLNLFFGITPPHAPILDVK